ncbi:response regulator [Aestuariibacter halophilus]|uniref:histidine kinase n=1 Tax=Fluctibacter halophilus TaxID=226011 RepID=A0ABS8GCM3_9ALTE|nr:response regulator [Aestuariibacter halophilus]MCC2617856.1 response regulator [Aestuariibacter halophilus]
MKNRDICSASTYLLLCFLLYGPDAKAVSIERQALPTQVLPAQPSQSVTSGIVYALSPGRDSLWQASENGLSQLRYGDKNTHIAYHPERFPYVVWRVAEHDAETVLLATLSGGLMLYNPLTRTVQVIDQRQGLSSNQCHGLLRVKGSEYVGLCGDGLYRFGIGKQVIEIEPIAQDVQQVSASDGDVVYLTRTGKHCRVSGQVRSCYPVGSPSASEKPSPLIMDNSGGLWHVEGEHLLHYPPPTETASSFQSIDISLQQCPLTTLHGVRVLKNGHTLAYGDRLCRLHPLGEVFLPFGTRQATHAISHVVEVDDDGLAILDNVNGMSFLPHPRNGIGLISGPDGEPLINVDASFVLEQAVFIAHGDSIYRFEPKSLSAQPLLDDIGYVDAVVSMSDTRAIAAISGKGLVVFDWNGETLSAHPIRVSGDTFGGDDIAALAVVGDNLYVTQRGAQPRVVRLQMQEGQSASAHPVTDGSFEVAVALNNGNALLIGRDQRALMVAPKGIVQTFTIPRVVPTCGYATADNAVAICTHGQGLGRLALDSGEWQSTTHSAGFFVRDVIHTGQQAWVLSNQGAFWVRNSTSRWIPLGESDGVYDTDFEFTASLKVGQNVLLAGDHLTYWLDTQVYSAYLQQKAARSVNIALSAFCVEREGRETACYRNIEHEQGSHLLDSDMRGLQLRFERPPGWRLADSGLAYRLMGYDETWTTQQGVDTIRYGKLAPGDYQLEYQGINPKADNVQLIHRLSFTVAQPFFSSGFGYAVYGLCAVMLVWAFFKLRLLSLQRFNQHLENSVSQRTIELARSHRKVADMLRKKQQLFVNISHELRTPLTLLTGPLSVLEKLLTSSKAKQQHRLISRSTQRLITLVDQILDLAQKAEQEQILALCQVDKNLGYIVESCRPLAASRGQNILLFNLCQGFVHLPVDGFDKVVVNLLSNACKYAPPNSCILVYSEQCHQHLSLRVQNAGHTIPASMLQRIFKRLVRLPDGLEQHGRGVGLSVVHDMVEKGRGAISVRSTSSGGTSFIVSLPLATQPDTRVSEEGALLSGIDKPPSAPNEIREPQQCRGGNQLAPTMLIAEDEPELRAFLVNTFSQEYRVQACCNGRRALAMALESVPDIVISDIVMPEMSGLALCEALRSNDATSHIPLLLLTGRNDRDSRIKGWQQNVDDFVAKPFVMHELEARVRRLIDVRRLIARSLHQQVSQQDSQEVVSDSVITFEKRRERQFFERFETTVAAHYTDPEFNREKAAQMLNFSTRQLNRKLSALADYNFNDYLRNKRLQEAKKRLLTGLQITTVAYDVGFRSPTYFTNCFREAFGMSPSEYIRLTLEARGEG